MVYLTREEIERLIKEDVPYIDLTSLVLGIDEQEAVIQYFTREDIVVCATEEVAQVFDCLHIELTHMHKTGKRIKAGEVLIEGRGCARDVHMAWKVGQNLLDHCSGIATKTAQMVKKAKEINPNISILTTRKGFPGTKALSVKAILAGGAMPHRLGVSESVLVFPHHLNLIGGMDEFLKHLPEYKAACCEKKLLVEAKEPQLAYKLCEAGVDGIQFDKLPAEEMFSLTTDLKSKYPNVILLAAGGINENNVVDYAKSPLDGIVTTSLYSAKPVDIGVRILPRNADS